MEGHALQQGRGRVGDPQREWVLESKAVEHWVWGVEEGKMAEEGEIEERQAEGSGVVEQEGWQVGGLEVGLEVG
jgi:hypothetical protein